MRPAVELSNGFRHRKIPWYSPSHLPMPALPGFESILRAALVGSGRPPDAAKWLLPLVGDVGTRSYFRYAPDDGGSQILAVFPAKMRDACERFLATTELLTRAGVRVPRVLAADCTAGWTWLEDLGPQTLYQRFRTVPDPWEELTPWYRRAMSVLDAVRALPMEAVSAVGNPPLDAELLRRELALTETHFLEPRGHSGWGPVLDDLVAEIGAVPRVPCHRDFMLRNLMPLEDGGDDGGSIAVGVLDHQDLRPGPPLYDEASLLNDSLFPPAEVVTALLADRSLLYHRVAAQRTLKAVGTYARTGHHADLVEPTFSRARSHLARVPEARGLVPTDDLVD